jgi:hypothetical protein
MGFIEEGDAFNLDRFGGTRKMREKCSLRVLLAESCHFTEILDNIYWDAKMSPSPPLMGHFKVEKHAKKCGGGISGGEGEKGISQDDGIPVDLRPPPCASPK